MSTSTTEETFVVLSEFYTLMFKHDGFFNKKEIAKAKVPIYEMMTRHLHDIHVVSTGSTVDGSILSGSDLDRMFVVQNMIVFDEVDIDDRCKYHFQIETDEDQPCYVKLVLKSNLDQPDLNDIMTFLETVDGSLYLSSEKYRNLKIIPDCSKWKSSYGSTSNFVEHGPCGTSVLQLDNNSLKTIEIDLTEGIPCTEWPVVAQEWVIRQRMNGWPSERFLSQVRNLPIYVVPVGNRQSGQYSLEWRLSFITIERELVWSFNQTQFHCFFILKYITKGNLEPLAPDELSTYHLKTIIFWLSEESQMEWKPSNLISLVLSSLEKLKDAISQKVLKHYILNNHNLFHNKFAKLDLRRTIVDKIDSVMKHFISSLLECQLPFQEDNEERIKAAECLIKQDENAPSLLELFEDDTDKIKNDDRCRKYSAIFSIIISIVRHPINATKLTELLDIMDESVNVSNFEIVLATKMFAVIRLAMLYHLDYMNIIDPSPIYFEGGIFESDVIDSSDPSEKIVRLEAAKCAFELGCRLDSMSGHLYYIMFLLVQNDLHQMVEVMNELLEKNTLLIYEGLCSPRKGVRISDGEISQVNEVPDNIHNDPIPGPICYDVIFIGDDVRCVPDPIKFECELNDDTDGGFYFLYHPAVFVYFLAFEMHHRLKNTQETLLSLKRLSEMVEIVKLDNEGHRALNLLGYCYYKIDQEEEAFTIFKTSLEKKNNRQNAAVYHLCLMVLQHM